MLYLVLVEVLDKPSQVRPGMSQRNGLPWESWPSQVRVWEHDDEVGVKMRPTA